MLNFILVYQMWQHLRLYLTILILCGFSSPKTGALRLGHSQPSDISVSLFSKIFNTWIRFLSLGLEVLFPFPNREKVQSLIPDSFRKFPNNTGLHRISYLEIISSESSKRNVEFLQTPKYLHDTGGNHSWWNCVLCIVIVWRYSLRQIYCSRLRCSWPLRTWR